MKLIISILLTASVCFASPIQQENVAAKCGTPAIKPDTSTNIIGGKDAVPYSWPWQVSIHRKRNATYFSHTCGASILSNQWILSAGHCFADTNLDTYILKLGVFNQLKTDESGEKILKLSEIHVHPKFGSSGALYDISVLKLAEPIEFTDHISPVCLPTEQDEALPQAGTNIFLTGWGVTKPGLNGAPNVTTSATLKQLGIPILSKERCGDGYVCIGGPGTGKSACFGDSGGPAVVQGSNGQWKQIGIASYVTESTCQGFSFYTQISKYLDFVQQYVKDL